MIARTIVFLILCICLQKIEAQQKQNRKAITSEIESKVLELQEFPTQIHCPSQLAQKIRAIAELAYTYYGNNIQKNVEYIYSKLKESSGWTVAIIPNYIDDSKTQTFITFGWYTCGIRQQILKYQPNWLYVITDFYYETIYFTQQLSFQKNQKGNMTDELSSVIINTITLSRRIDPDDYIAQYNFIWDAMNKYNGNSYGFGACKKQQSKGSLMTPIQDKQWIVYTEPNSQDRYVIYKQYSISK